MKGQTLKASLFIFAKACVVAGLVAGCVPYDSGGYYGGGYYGGGYYGGTGWRDPHYYRPCCYGGGGNIIRPPSRPPMGSGRPVNLPSLPSRPSPSPMPSLRR